MSRSVSVYQAVHPPLHMDPFSNPSWRDSNIPCSGMVQYPSIPADHYKPLDQDPILTGFGGGGDMNNVYQTARQYESGVKDPDRKYTNCMKLPLSAMYNIQTDGNRVEVLGRTPPSVSLSSNTQQHEAIDHAIRFQDHNSPSQMIAARESVTPMVSSLVCRSSPACAPGVQMNHNQNQQELRGAFVNAPPNEGSCVVKVGSRSSLDMLISTDGSEAKTTILTHPLYPYLVEAHINCCKIGAESTDLEVLGHVLSNNQHLQPENNSRPSASTRTELDNVMVWYLRRLADLKEAMEEPFATEMEWCNEVFEKLKLLGPSSSQTEMTEGQIRTGRKEVFESTIGQRMQQSPAPSFDYRKGLTMEHMKEDKIVKEWLKTKHDRSQIYNLRGQCSKKRRQGKHPESARECLLEWFNGHGDWPYPSEEEKHKLAEDTKLETRQINNWFINQRKRHWESPIPEQTLQPVQQEFKSQRQYASIEEVFMDRFRVPMDVLNTTSYTWPSTLS